MNSWLAEFGGDFQGREVLVTGATGFIGRHLCQALCALGATVTGASRSGAPSRLPDGVKPLAADLSRSDGGRTVLEQCQPDLVFHLAGQVTASPDRGLVLPMFEANAAATVHLLEAAAARACHRLILVGSSEAPGSDRESGPASPYAASKLVGDIYGQMYHRLYGLPIVSLRLFLTYGPWQQPSKLIPYTILKLLRREAPVLTSGDRVCDVIYVEDVVRGLLKAAVAPAGVLGTRIDLGSGQGVTIRELAERLGKLIGTGVAPVFGGQPARSHEPSTLADVAPARTLLGWVPHWPLDEGLHGTVRWYRQHPEWGGAS